MKQYLAMLAFISGLGMQSAFAVEVAEATDGAVKLWCAFGGSMASIMAKNTGDQSVSACTGECEYVMQSGETNIQRVELFRLDSKESIRLTDNDLSSIIVSSRNASVSCGAKP